MATNKITFTKLALKKKEEIKTITFADQTIEVKQYLPIEDKIKIITTVLEKSIDDTNSFANPVKVDVFFALEIIYNYTNITFTDKQKEDEPKLFDLFEENKLIDAVVGAIPEDEYNNLFNWVVETISNFYKHQNSALGIMERISADYSDLNFDAQQIKDNIAEPGNLKLLKDVIEKLG